MSVLYAKYLSVFIQFKEKERTIFNIYIDDLLRNWKYKVDAGIVLKGNLYLNTSLFADDQVITQDFEDKLQKSIYILNQMSTDYNLKISTVKVKTVKVKVKFSRYRPGVAQRVGRGIALLFHDRGTGKG